MSQRLYAHAPNDDSLHLLATSYMNLGKANKAIAVLKVPAKIRSQRVSSTQGSSNPQCLFLLANAYFQLSKYKEAETALKDDTRQLHQALRGNAAAHHLLGQIYKVRLCTDKKSAKCDWILALQNTGERKEKKKQKSKP